jgi:DNA uptake protein ComE-like DNA-binding protein
MRRDFKSYFIFTKTEKRVILTLSFIIILSLLFKEAAALFYKPGQTKYSQEEYMAFAKLSNEYEVEEDKYAPYESNLKKTISYQEDKPKTTLFYFDPNQIGIEEWKKLGLSGKQAQSIENFKSKGGTFRKPEDIRKIFVLSDEKKEELIPWIKLSDTKPTYTKNTIDLNAADSASLEKLRGIGTKLAGRIVKYRGWLGGFYDVSQLKEVWGLSDSTYQIVKSQVSLKNPSITKIAINTAEFKTFKGHPYTRPIAGQVIKYRQANGNFASVNDFCKIPELSDSICKKLLPYLELN